MYDFFFIFFLEIGAGVGRDVLHPVLPDEHVLRPHRVPRLVVEGAGNRKCGSCGGDLAQRTKRPRRNKRFVRPHVEPKVHEEQGIMYSYKEKGVYWPWSSALHDTGLLVN